MGYETPISTVETVSRIEHLRSPKLSSTVLIDVGFTRRAIIVGTNLVAMLISLVVMWVSLGTSHSRPGHLISFWGHLLTRPFLFTFVMHFEVILIVISVLALITSSAGFLGALRENSFLLDVYHCGIVFFITSITAFAITLSIFPVALRNHVQKGVYRDFVTSYRDSPDFKNLIDGLQTSLRCCGFSRDSFRDWEFNQYFSCREDNPSRERCGVPASCCRVNDTATSLLDMLCGSGVLLEGEQQAWEKVYTRSCADATLSYVDAHLMGYLLLCIAITLFVVLMLTTSIVLYDEIRSMRLIYGVYYEYLALGQEKMKKEGVSLPPTPKSEHPLGEDDPATKALRHHIERAHSTVVRGVKRASACITNIHAYNHSKPPPIQRK
ncbi:hypothetical protein HPB47_014489 [Ixodes persulcatus]|uniref:Uncharacterized protein n=1 Tax=Ixodes persulcatus TaxID=34615 RepID=A0AC60QVV7_IXOPE|nr:hypothetical protein HPB47_014489 [Ixodes persulcatus]